MDLETANYIIIYFSNFLNKNERLANRHISSVIKLDSTNLPSKTETLTKVYRKSGWLTQDEDALALVKLGEEGFKLKVAERILSAHQNEIFMNHCPKCGRLARTPTAKQCRYCFHNWH